MKDIFKSYDVRGIYPTEINEKLVYNTARAFVQYLGAKTVAIGRDMRESSPRLYQSLVNGLTDQGADVLNLGEISTPMAYFASKKLNSDGTIILTASHNPKEYNGLKFTRKEAIPIGLPTGLAEIRDLAFTEEFEEVENVGKIKDIDITEEYYNTFANFANMGDSKFTVAIDYANAMGIKEIPIWERLSKNIIRHDLFEKLDSSFPNHEANPLNTETLADVQKKVIEVNADMGAAYDGDADRIGFVDEKGVIIPMDIITGVVATIILEKNPGATILYDLRSSKSIKEVIEENGGVALQCQVGHSNIKRQMREENAIFAGELSGHYYYKENSTAEASTLTAILILNAMAKTGKKLSELVTAIKRYHHSGEINSEVKDAEKIIQSIKEKYKDGQLNTLDGIKINYPTWWFSVRSSNTEPLLRLNLEADTKELLDEKQNELLALIRD